jgi:serine protease DegS
MDRWLIRLAAAALALAVGGFAAYALVPRPTGARGSGFPLPTLIAARAEAVTAASTPAEFSADAAKATRVPAIQSYRDAVLRTAPSVVTVHSAHMAKGPLPMAPKVRVRGMGSGVIVEQDGYIVTNHHVVEDASELAVALGDGALQLARVVGVDAESDIALLKIDARGLRPIALADMNEVAVGDVVLAVGNPLGVGQTVTQGIVSAVVRKGMNPVENFIQTDAAINPGNSGGALVDTAGRLVGLNTAMLSHSGGSEGIGFAIPVDYVQAVAAALKAKGRVARAWLGVTTTAQSAGKGALVVSVEPDGPAGRAGIETGDIIVRLGDKPVSHAQDARSVVIGIDPGTLVAVDLVRKGEHATVAVELGPVPLPQTAR